MLFTTRFPIGLSFYFSVIYIFDFPIPDQTTASGTRCIKSARVAPSGLCSSHRVCEQVAVVQPLQQCNGIVATVAPLPSQVSSGVVESSLGNQQKSSDLASHDIERTKVGGKFFWTSSQLNLSPILGSDYLIGASCVIKYVCYLKLLIVGSLNNKMGKL